MESNLLRSFEAQILRAEMYADEAQFQRLRELDGHNGSGWAEVMPVALSMAAWRRFGNYDLRLVTRFARRFTDDDADGHAFEIAEVEAVVRGVLGEDLLLRSVDPARAGEIMYATLFALVDDLQLSDDEIDRLLIQAERTAEGANQRSAGRSEGDPPHPPMLDGRMHRRTGKRYLLPVEVAAARPVATRTIGYAGRPERRQRSGRGKQRKLSRHVPSSVAGVWVVASLLRRREERLRAESLLRELRRDDIPRMVRAVFDTAVRRQFTSDVPLQEIASLVIATRVFFESLDLMKSEYLIRAALGEDVPDVDVDLKTEISLKTLMLGAIADWWKRDEALLNDIVVEAEISLGSSGVELVPCQA